MAQQTLEPMNSGLTIDQCTLEQVIAPLRFRRDFEKVAAAVSETAPSCGAARPDGPLDEVERGWWPCGGVSGGESTESRRVVGLITRYEVAIASGDKACR